MNSEQRAMLVKIRRVLGPVRPERRNEPITPVQLRDR